MLYQNIDELNFTKKEGYAVKRAESQPMLPSAAPVDPNVQKLFFSESSFCISGVSYGNPFFVCSENAEKYLIYPTSFFDSEYDSRYFTQRKNMQSFEIRYTYEGCGKLIYENEEYPLPPGTGFFIDNRKPHYYETVGDKWFCTELHFDGVLVSNLYEKYIGSGSPIFTDQTCPNFKMYQYEILRKISSYEPYREYSVSNLFTTLLTDMLTNKNRFFSVSQKLPDIVKYTVEYIEQHYDEKVSIDKLSSRQFISRRHLTREFTRFMGTSPKKYLGRVRILKARELLVSTDLSIGEIAIRTGFGTDSRFIEFFKKETDTTPMQYRKINR